MSETINDDRRRMLGASLMTLAAAELLWARPAKAQAAGSRISFDQRLALANRWATLFQRMVFHQAAR